MRRENTKTRITQMLNADKEEMNEATKNALLADFRHLAQEYFEMDGDLDFQLRKVKNHYEISLNFRSARIKNFTVLK